MEHLEPYVRRIAAARVASGFTQSALAELSGVPQSTLSKIESGVIANPSFADMIRLTHALDVRLDRLVAEEESEFLLELEWLSLVYQSSTGKEVDTGQFNAVERWHFAEAVAKRRRQDATRSRLALTDDDMLAAVREAMSALQVERLTSSAYDVWRESTRGRWRGRFTPPSSSVMRRRIGRWETVVTKALAQG